MLITSSIALRNYLKTFVNQFGIKAFAYGDYDRILTVLKAATTQYPLFWAERPSLQIIEDGGRKKQFTLAIVVVKNTNNLTTYEQEDTLIAECEDIIESILKKLEADASDDTFEFDKTTANIESFERTSGDIWVGCRAEIKIIGAIDCE